MVATAIGVCRRPLGKRLGQMVERKIGRRWKSGCHLHVFGDGSWLASVTARQLLDVAAGLARAVKPFLPAVASTDALLGLEVDGAACTSASSICRHL